MSFNNLKELNELKEQGLITEDEFFRAKEKIQMESKDIYKVGDFLKNLAIVMAILGCIGSIVIGISFGHTSHYNEYLGTMVSDDEVNFTLFLVYFASGALATSITAGTLYAFGELLNDIKDIKMKL